MNLFYIRPEVKITATGVNIKINNDNYVIQELEKIDDIMITAKSGYISIYALRLLAMKGVTLTLHNLNGELIYHIIPESPKKTIDNRILQYKAFIQNKQEIADKIVKRKHENYNRLLEAYNKPLIKDKSEGLFAEEYFSYLGALLNDFGYDYYSRSGLYSNSNQKAIHIINATLNLFYGYIEHRLLTSISQYDLDYNLSFLHKPQYNKLSLTYDLIELLRADIDKCVLEMAESRRIQRSHFTLEKNGYYLLKEEKLKGYLKNIEPVEKQTDNTVKTFIHILEAF